MNYKFMKKFIYLSILAIMLVVGIVLAQKNNGLTIHDRWKQVEEFAEKQLLRGIAIRFLGHLL